MGFPDGIGNASFFNRSDRIIAGLVFLRGNLEIRVRISGLAIFQDLIFHAVSGGKVLSLHKAPDIAGLHKDPFTAGIRQYVAERILLHDAHHSGIFCASFTDIYAVCGTESILFSDHSAADGGFRIGVGTVFHRLLGSRGQLPGSVSPFSAT